MSSDAAGMTPAQYAAHRGCSDSYVRRMRREGRLAVNAAGLIDAAASDRLLADTTDPIRGGDRSAPSGAGAVLGTVSESAAIDAPTGGEVGDVGLREAMRRERLAKARLAELELGEEARQLVRVKQVDRDVFTLARQALERLRSIPSRLRGKLAAESDPRACEALLDAEVAIVCEELQAAARAMATAMAGTNVAAEPRQAA